MTLKAGQHSLPKFPSALKADLSKDYDKNMRVFFVYYTRKKVVRNGKHYFSPLKQSIIPICSFFPSIAKKKRSIIVSLARSLSRSQSFDVVGFLRVPGDHGPLLLHRLGDCRRRRRRPLLVTL